VKRGKLPRGAIDQLLDYFGMMKQRFPEKPVELIVVANEIPSERRLTCESRNIECRGISEKTFETLALEIAYAFASEATQPWEASSAIPSARGDTDVQRVSEGTSNWSYGKAADSAVDSGDFLSHDAAKTFFKNILRGPEGCLK
jgi:hypothetical protein